MQKSNVAIIGFGSIGKKHYKILRKSKKIDKIFIISESLKKIKDKKTKIFKSNNELNNFKIDFVFICSPASKHLNDAIFFMKKKAQIFIEKPISSSLNKLKKNIKILKKYKKHIYVGYPFRFSKAAKKVKQIIKNKKLGTIVDVEVVCGSYLPRWRKGKSYKKSVSSHKKLGGGALLELSHEIDYILWIFGYPKKVVSYYGKNNLLNIKSEEFLRALLIYENFSISIKLSFNQRHLEERYCKIIGSNNNMVWDVINKNIKIYKNNKKTKFISFKKEDNNILSQEAEYVLKKFNKKSKFDNKTVIEDSLKIMTLVQNIQTNKLY